MTIERCSSCGRKLLWSAGRLICANANCTDGHQTEGACTMTFTVHEPSAAKFAPEPEGQGPEGRTAVAGAARHGHLRKPINARLPGGLSYAP
jgi:hypothetical protein